MRGVLQRAALVALGLAIGLGLLEGALRLAALVLPARFERESAAAQRKPEPGELVVLCVGDSHTFGVGVEANQAYPVQVEELLRRRGVRARVINAGTPGRNSGQLREVLPPMLERYRPRVVIVWIGANNQWVPIGAGDAPAFRDRFRLVRLLRLLLGRNEGVSGDFRRDLDTALVAPTDRPMIPTGPRERRTTDVTASVTRRDIGPIVDAIRAAGAVPVLLTYPITLGPMLAAIDDAIVAEAAAHRARVIDLRVMARRHLPRIRHLLLPDIHPNARLYRVIGWEIARTFVREGVAAGEGVDARSAGAATKAGGIPMTSAGAGAKAGTAFARR
jgi:lysophospholipase L1-like esterase